MSAKAFSGEVFLMPEIISSREHIGYTQQKNALNISMFPITFLKLDFLRDSKLCLWSVNIDRQA